MITMRAIHRNDRFSNGAVVSMAAIELKFVLFDTALTFIVLHGTN